jgi:hypothetical protein
MSEDVEAVRAAFEEFEEQRISRLVAFLARLLQRPDLMQEWQECENAAWYELVAEHGPAPEDV